MDRIASYYGFLWFSDYSVFLFSLNLERGFEETTGGKEYLVNVESSETDSLWWCKK